MQMRKKESGFSLVELLAVVVILGLLSAIAIVGVNSVIKNAEKRHYESQMDALKMAAQSYTQDNRNALPKTIGGQTTVTLKTLQEKKYLDEINDRQGNVCDNEKSNVRVFKYSKDGYSYTVNLVCPGYDNTKNNEENIGPSIDLVYNDGMSESINNKITKNTYKDPKVDIEIKKNKDILSYSYIVYECIDKECKTELKNSGSIEALHQDEVKESIPLKSYFPGKVRLVVTATDIYGNTSTKEVEVEVTTKDGPKCGEIMGDSTEWLTTSDDYREVTVKCIDTNGSGCERESYSQIFREETTFGQIEIKDNSGKVTKCKVNVYVDKTPPDKPKITNPYNDKWINKDYTITAESKDDVSGISYFEYRYPNSNDEVDKNWKKIGNEGDKKISINETKNRAVTLEIRACDKAGNCSEIASTVIKIDKIPPTIATEKTDIGSESGISVIVNCSDSISGCKNPTETFKGVKKDTTYTVVDNAGNVSEPSSITVSSYDCNPHQYPCNPYACDPYPYVCGTYVCGERCVGCDGDDDTAATWYEPIYCLSYCTGWNTCYNSCTAYETCYK